MNRRKHDPLSLPARWLHCPRRANSLVGKYKTKFQNLTIEPLQHVDWVCEYLDKFLAFKVPLNEKYSVQTKAIFHVPSGIINSCGSYGDSDKNLYAYNLDCQVLI